MDHWFKGQRKRYTSTVARVVYLLFWSSPFGLDWRLCPPSALPFLRRPRFFLLPYQLPIFKSWSLRFGGLAVIRGGIIFLLTLRRRPRWGRQSFTCCFSREFVGKSKCQKRALLSRPDRHHKHDIRTCILWNRHQQSPYWKVKKLSHWDTQS